MLDTQKDELPNQGLAANGLNTLAMAQRPLPPLKPKPLDGFVSEGTPRPGTIQGSRSEPLGTVALCEGNGITAEFWLKQDFKNSHCR
jgi:hypothetical protein